MMINNIQVFSDGGSRGNPGPGAIGVVIKKSDGSQETISHYIGHCTNNEAEYTAVIEGLAKITQLKIDPNEEIIWNLDSELVVKQLNGIYKIKQEHLAKMANIIHQTIKDNNLNITFRHIYREANKQADALVNLALDLELKGSKNES